jgi:hypothetical protein
MSSEIYSGNPQLKKAHTNIEFTAEQVKEYIKCSKDPVYFAKNYIKIISVDEGVVPFKMYKFQEKLIKNFHKHRFNICKLPRQPLCLNTPIPTTNGWKIIRDIKIGDYVYTPDGTPVKVIKKSEIFYNTNCYKIYFDSGEELIADERHLWEINVDNKVRILETSQIYKSYIENKKLYIKSAIIPDGYKKTNKNFPKDGKHSIIKVEKTKSTPVCCITVDNENHLFVCGNNFISTHNSGKSTTAVSYLLHYAIFNPSVNIAILANKAQTAKDLLSRLQLAYENLPKWLQQGVKIWNKASLELDNGSKIIAASTSASSVRGGTYNIIFLDEFAFIPNQIAEDFFRSTYPTITSGKNTKVMIISCVTKDTYLLTQNGYRKIQTLIDETKKGAYIVPEYIVRGKDKFYKSNVIVNNQKCITNIIKTRYETLECSQEHKLWAFKNGKYDYFKSKDLTIGDYVSIKYNQQIFGDDDYIGYRPIKDKSSNSFSCEYINEDIAYFIGLYVSEGCARDFTSKDNNKIIGGQIVISCGDDVSNALNKLNIRYKKVDDVHYIINSKHLLEFIKLLGFNIKLKAKEKFLPNKVLSWSKSNITALLRGMFDGDGGIDARGRITYTSTSRELIRQVQLLLGNLGILGSIYEATIPPSKIVKVSSKNYTIEIVGKYAFEYFKQIGFSLERKYQRISVLKESNRNGSRTDIIPNSAIILKEYEASKIADRKKDFKHYSRAFLLSKKNILCSNEKVKEFFDDNINENLIWLEIKSLEKGENEVFDVSLPDIDGDKWAHSVLYNNFLGHQTPKGMNMYYKLWTEAERSENEYVPTEVHWSEVPGRDQRFKDQTISNIGLDSWNQEFECSFLGSAGTLISASKIKTLIYDKPISKSGGLDIYKPANKDSQYLIIADCSEGVGKDYHAFIVFDITKIPYTIAAKYKNNMLKPMLLADIIKTTAVAYNNAYVLIEIASVGEQVAKNIHYDLEYGNMLMSTVNGRAGQVIGQGLYGRNSQYGLKISKQVKRVGCSNLKTIVEDDKILIRDVEIISELTTFIAKNNSYEAEIGCNDDLVSCLVIFAWLIVQDYFKDLTNNDVRKKISEEQKEQLDLELAPLCFFDDGMRGEEQIIDKETGDVWLNADNFRNSIYETFDVDPYAGSYNNW